MVVFVVGQPIAEQIISVHREVVEQSVELEHAVEVRVLLEVVKEITEVEVEGVVVLRVFKVVASSVLKVATTMMCFECRVKTFEEIVKIEVGARAPVSAIASFKCRFAIHIILPPLALI